MRCFTLANSADLREVKEVFKPDPSWRFYENAFLLG